MSTVALTLQIKSNSATLQTVERIAELRLQLSQVTQELREAQRAGNQGVYKKAQVEATAFRKEISELNKRLNEQTRALTEVARVPGSYNDLRAQVVRLTAEYRELGAEARNGIGGRDLLNRIQRLNREINEIQTNLSPFRQSLNGVVSGFNRFNSLLAAGGIFLGLQEFVQLVGDSIRTFADFQQSIATLGAVTGASGQDLSELSRNARILGETTQFTANQVAELQIILGRRGFTPDAIIDATEAIVNLSIATQESTERSADVVSSVIQAYSNEALNAAEITDVLTEALNSSALQLDTFAEASKLIAPVANTLGADFAEITASIGLLANNGLEGSIATRTLATALQRLTDDTSKQAEAAQALGVEIFNNNGEFIGLAEVLANIEEATAGFTEQQRLAAISQIFGQEATKNFATLLEATFDTFQDGEPVTLRGAEALAAYTEQLENSEGQAARTAAVVGDTLTQDLLKFQSAIEGLQINLVDLFDGGLRSVVQGFTDLVTVVNEFIKVPVSDQLREEQVELNALVGSLSSANLSEEARSDLISEIQAKYPDFVKNIDLENATTEQLQAALEQVNNEYRQRILLQVANEEVQRRQEELQGRINDQTREIVSQTRALQAAQDLLGDSTLSVGEALEALRAEGAQQISQFGGVGQSVTRLNQVYSELVRTSVGVEGSTNRLNDSQEALNQSQQEADQTLQIIRENYPEIAALLESTTVENETLKTSLEETPQTNTSVSALDAEAKAAIGSVQNLRERISELKSDIESSNDPQAIEPLVSDLVELEGQLEKAEEQIASFRGEVVDLDNIQSSLNLDLSLGDLNEDIENAFTGINAANVEDVIDDINVRRLRAIEAARPAEEGEEEAFQERRKQINLQADIDILQARQQLLDPDSAEFLRIEQEIADKRVAINKEADTQIRRERSQLQTALQDLAFSSIQQAADAAFSLQQNNIQRELDADQERLERQTEQRIEAAQGNQELIDQIEAESQARSEELQAEAARKEQRIAVSKALINGALGITKAFAELIPPFNFIQAAAVAASTAAQVAVINSQQFAKGGLLQGKSHAQGGIPMTVSSTGQRVELEGGEAVINKRSMASNRVLTLTGTPRQIASNINSMNGYGVRFQEGGLITGGVPQLVNPNTAIPGASGQVQQNPGLSESDVQRIVQAVQKGATIGTRNGLSEGLDDANRMRQRQIIAESELNT